MAGTKETARPQGMTTPVAVGEKGLPMPQFGLGTWLTPKKEIYEAVLFALEKGYRHIDGAFVYENEDGVGDAIAEAISKGVCKREELWVTSKLWLNYFQPSRVRMGIEKTLKALKLDYVDQYLMHYPGAFKAGDELFPEALDTSVDIRDTWKEMEKLYEEGLARTIGVSNFTVPELQMILESCKVKPAVNQVECHPYFQQNDMRKFMAENGMTLVAYCPFGSKGFSESDQPALKDPLINAMAEAKQKTPAQILLRWGLQIGNIVIPKSVKPERIIENSQIYDFSLTDEEMSKIANIGVVRRQLNPTFIPGGKPWFAE